MRGRSLLLAFAAFGFSQAAYAVSYTNEVLAIGVGARALGMGGANVAAADDSSAVYWNPAALTNIQHMDVAAVQQGRENTALNLGTDEVGSQYFYMSGGATLPTVGSFGLAILRYGVDGIDQVPAAAAGSQPTDAPPGAIGSFSTQDLAVLAGYGHSIGKAFDAGLTLKGMFGGTQGLKADPTTGLTGDETYSYFGSDLGLLVHFGGLTPTLDGLTFGLDVQDALKGNVTWSTGASEPVDTNPKAGLAYSLPFDFLKDNKSSFTLAMDADPKYSILMHYGAELWYKDVLAFRAGMRQFAGDASQNGQANEFSYGASFRFYMLQADYAYVAYELTPIQYLSLVVRF